MKKLSGLLFIAVLLMATTAFASSNKVKKELMEDNLIAGLQSDNLGLKTSSAYFLGEYGSSKCVNSLLKVLKSGETEEERISAAVSLIKIDSDKGFFAVKQRAKYDDSERVRRICSMLYKDSLQKN
jgi:HEAT repeat protein